MANDRFVNFERGKVPSRDDVRKIIEDYLASALLRIEDGNDRFFVWLIGDNSHPFKRVLGKTNDEGERIIEVVFGNDYIDALTRRQDEYTNTLAFGLTRILARYGQGVLEADASGEVPVRHDAWVRPFLWRLWRSGGYKITDVEFQHLVRMFGIELKALQPLVLDGLLSNDGNHYVLTAKGLSFVCRDETPLWKERIRKVKYDEIHTRAQQAFELQSRHKLSLAEIGDVMKLSRTRVDTLLQIYQHTSAVRKVREKAVKDFLEDRLPLEKLPVEALGDFSVTVLNVFHNMGVVTVPQLLSLTQRQLLKQKNIGRKFLKEILSKLEACDETLSLA